MIIYQLHFYQQYDGILAESIRKYTIIQLKSRGDTEIYFFLDLFSNGIYLLYRDFVAPSVLFIGILPSAPVAYPGFFDQWANLHYGPKIEWAK